MYTIKRNRIIITIDRMGKLFEIKRTTPDQTITAYAKRKDIESKISLLLQPLKVIEGGFNV